MLLSANQAIGHRVSGPSSPGYAGSFVAWAHDTPLVFLVH